MTKAYNIKQDVFMFSVKSEIDKHTKEEQRLFKAWHLLKDKTTLYAESIWSCRMKELRIIQAITDQIESHKKLLKEMGYDIPQQ